jgi:hypothetical protein
MLIKKQLSDFRTFRLLPINFFTISKPCPAVYNTDLFTFATLKKTSMSETAQLKIGDKTYDFPVIEGTEGEKAIDISKLRDQTGYVTLDIGYKNTGATQSAITFLDGELGILKYRGYPIEQLASKSSFI